MAGTKFKYQKFEYFIALINKTALVLIVISFFIQFVVLISFYLSIVKLLK